MRSPRLWLLVMGGLLYILLAYMPLPGPYSLFFGIGGGLITLLFMLILFQWAKDRNRLDEHGKTASDYRMIGYFFFAMATYNLCPLLGVRTFGLMPEKMIQYGLQSDAASFATHIMIELLLGWGFIFLGYWKSNDQPENRTHETTAAVQ